MFPGPEHVSFTLLFFFFIYLEIARTRVHINCNIIKDNIIRKIHKTVYCECRPVGGDEQYGFELNTIPMENVVVDSHPPIVAT